MMNCYVFNFDDYQIYRCMIPEDKSKGNELYKYLLCNYGFLKDKIEVMCTNNKRSIIDLE